MGSCGDLIFELGWFGIAPDEYSFVEFNEDNTLLIISSEDRAEEGTYSVPFSARLPNYPNAQMYKEYFTVVVAVDNIPEPPTSIAWYLLPIITIIFLVVGVFVGIAYQKRKDGSLTTVGQEKAERVETEEGPGG